MERLTYRDANGEAWYSDAGTEANRLHFIADMEDILGGGYDLDRLRELVEADRDGRCVVLPVRGYTDKDGEQALNSAMNTCFYHNNPVTRYIADAVAEKTYPRSRRGRAERRSAWITLGRANTV